MRRPCGRRNMRKSGIEAETLNTRNITITLAIFGVLAAIAAAGLNWPLGTVNAQTPPLKDVTTRSLTEAEWNELYPRTASQTSGARSAPREYGLTDLEPFYATMQMGWGFLAADDVVAYRIERRLVEPDGTENGYTLLHESTTNISRKDWVGAPGEEYIYRITPKTTTVPKPPHISRPIHLFPRGGFYGYAVGGDAVALRIVPTDDFVSTGDKYRVTRYSSPSDQGTVSDPTYLVDIPQTGLTANKVYRFKLEIVEYDSVTDAYVALQDVTDIYVKTGAPDLNAVTSIPTSIVVWGNGTQANLDWATPSGLHRSQFAFYEVLKRNAKDWKASYEVIGSIVDVDLLTAHNFASGQYFEYTVRAVGWGHVHGPVSATYVHPEIPDPTCTLADGTTADVTTMELTLIMDFMPANKWHGGFYPWAVSYDSDADQNRSCVTLDLSDWYIVRAIWHQHSLSSTCTDPSASCNVVAGGDMYSLTGYDYADGDFQDSEPLQGMTKPIWYDAPNPESGRYRYAYKICSYADPDGCSVPFGGPWRFEGVDSVPFTK